MRGAAAGPPIPEKRRASPGRLTLATSQIINEDQHTAAAPATARAATYLSRRYALRIGLASIIAGEIGLGGKS
jgi:hypothetical protein